MRRLLLLPLLFSAGLSALAQNLPAPGEISASEAAPPPPPADDAPSAAASAAKSTPTTPAGSDPAAQTAMNHLIRANQDLLDLLKKQQAVLEDIQYDRRLQNRQITLLEQRLEDTLQLNASLQAKEARLEAASKNGPTQVPTDDTDPVRAKTDAQLSADETQPPSTSPSPPPSALPPEESPGAPGSLWWHRVMSLTGSDSKQSDTFRISGHQWRVLWHNQDKPGKAYVNTSALFINALRRNDDMPRKICSQLGAGGDVTVLNGSGEYFLKIEASGGRWELAVEDFH